jgi:hypothetical protein
VGVHPCEIERRAGGLVPSPAWWLTKKAEGLSRSREGVPPLRLSRRFAPGSRVIFYSVGGQTVNHFRATDTVRGEGHVHNQVDTSSGKCLFNMALKNGGVSMSRVDLHDLAVGLVQIRLIKGNWCLS